MVEWFGDFDAISGDLNHQIVQKMLHEENLKNFAELYRGQLGQSNQLSQLIDLI